MSEGTNAGNEGGDDKQLNGAHANGAAKDDAPADDDADTDETAAAEPEALPPEPPPPAVAELASSCVRFVEAKFGVLLDGTQDTLSLLDAYVQDARKSTAERPETMPLLAASVGAYFGEVVRLAFGATWETAGDYDTWRLCLKHVYLAFNPIGTAVEALTEKEEAGYRAHLVLESDDGELLQRRLAALGEVDEAEYYLPTTRFDVISIAFDAIRGRMLEDGTADVIFTPDDYEK